MTARAAKHTVELNEDVALAHDDPRWKHLHQVIDEKSLKIGHVILSSGRSSNFHFQLRQTTMLGEGMHLIGEIILDYMTRRKFNSVGGLVQGAVPLAAAACYQGYLRSYPVKAFFVRKEEKPHGQREIIDGYVGEDDDILLVDDVATTGGSILDAVKGIRKVHPGATLQDALVIVDREEGAKAALAAKGIRLVSLFKRSDFPRIPAG